MSKILKSYKPGEIKLESQLETFFCNEVKKAGGWPIKFNSVGTSGLPDQIVFYKGFTWLVELKLPKGTVQPVQKIIHGRFALQGFEVRVVRTKEQVFDFISDMQNFNS